MATKRVAIKSGKASHYAFSTLATNVKFVIYYPAPVSDKGNNLDYIPVEKASVVVKGGAGVMTKHLLTPQGVATSLTDEQVSILRSSSLFTRLEKRNMVKISTKYADPEVFAPDMAIDEGSAPLTPLDYTKDGDPKPYTGAPKEHE